MALGPLADHTGSAAGEAVTYGPEAVVIPGLLAGDDERVCQGSRPSWLLAGAASYQLALHRHRDRTGRVGRGATTAPPPVVPPVEAPSQHRPGPARGAPGQPHRDAWALLRLPVANRNMERRRNVSIERRA